jgi:hypothetical protein
MRASQYADNPRSAAGVCVTLGLAEKRRHTLQTPVKMSQAVTRRRYPLREFHELKMQDAWFECPQ